MDYRRLGRAGLKVSEICLGTMTFGNGADEAEAKRMVDAAFDAGVNFFDTANAYVGGVSETMLGKALKGRRSDAIVASKVFNPMGGRPNDSGMSRLHIMQAVEDSLRRLQTDYLDLYYIHHVDVQTPLDEMLQAFDDLVRQGKVLYTGCSNYEAWRLMKSLSISDARGWARFVAYQPQYSLVVRDIDEEIVPACESEGLGVVAWSPLASGYLAGKYTPSSLKVQGTRSAEGWGFQSRFFAPNHGEILQAVRRREGDRQVAGAGGAALGHGSAFHDQRHRRRTQCSAARRDSRRGRLAPAGRGSGEARQGFQATAPVPSSV